MFEPIGYGAEIFQKRYALFEGETWLEACKRVSQHVASAESPDKFKRYCDLFFQELSENRFMPGGRIWYGSGRPKGGLLNCFVLDALDSREGWAKVTADMIQISGLGGGVGINFSKVRPRGELIRGVGGEATGAVSLMELINAVGDVIKGGGGRRVALMQCLNIDHPDLPEFLDKKNFQVQETTEAVTEAVTDMLPRLKSDKDFVALVNSISGTETGLKLLHTLTKNLHDRILQNANVSVVIPHGKLTGFIAAVRDDLNWDMTWRGETKKTVKAREIWQRLVDNAYDSAEPGILNFDLAERMSNISYTAKLTSTNPCGEIVMSPNEVCCLGSLVLPRFVDGGVFKWSQLADTIAVAVRFLDNVLDVNVYPIPETKETAQKFRRIGLGVTGLHDVLLSMGLKYTSPEGLAFVADVMNFIKRQSYETSCFIAAEKGHFPAYDFDGYSKSEFYQALPIGLQHKIRHYGIRNCALNSIAPTGTISIVCGVTSGIEPIFAYAYERRYFDGDEIKVAIVKHPLFEKFVAEGRDVSHFQSSYDLTVKDHLEVQKTCQTHVDQAISKTINIPKGYPRQDLYTLLLEYLPHLKGLTLYVEGSRGAPPLKSLSLEDAQKTIDCPKGICDI